MKFTLEKDGFGYYIKNTSFQDGSDKYVMEYVRPDSVSGGYIYVWRNYRQYDFLNLYEKQCTEQEALILMNEFIDKFPIYETFS